MKTFKLFFSTIAQSLVILIFLQSCNIYKAQNISLEQAAETSRKVRVKTQGEKLVFDRIENSINGFYGYARENSTASKKLQTFGVIGRERGKFYRFSLQGLNIEKVQAKNYTTSTIGTIAVMAAALVAVIAVLAGGSNGISPGIY